MGKNQPENENFVPDPNRDPNPALYVHCSANIDPNLVASRLSSGEEWIGELWSGVGYSLGSLSSWKSNQSREGNICTRWVGEWLPAP